MFPRFPRLLAVACSCAVGMAMVAVCAQPASQGPWSSPEGRGPRHSLPPIAIDARFDVILGRPTDRSITLSLMGYERSQSVSIAYGMDLATLNKRTPTMALQRGAPTEHVIEGLLPDTHYHYRVVDELANTSLATGSFHTQRKSGGTFRFTVTADSHLDGNTDPRLYQYTLASALADRPDFHVDLGDTFMTEKHESRDAAAVQYRVQRYFFGQMAHSAPVFLVLGNHDGEEARQLRDGANSLGVWANGMRKRYFPNPEPNDFYLGNAKADALAGPLQDYYAWQWGDALFVVLNPYWHAPKRRSEERWGLSLGHDQYQWLKATLERSQARYKFVFVHQLVGGIDRQGRGGIEGVPYGEWGGKNADGSDGFQQQRPGWDIPIHDLLVRHHVSAVFHGHDHLFAKQELDGIVYQEVPQPGHPGSGNERNAAEYGYRAGTIMGHSGYLAITVAPEATKVDYVGAERAPNGGSPAANRKTYFSYSIAPYQATEVRKP